MISIIIPVYNRIEALKKALASIASQTYKDVEVIVVDDGSEVEHGTWNMEQLSPSFQEGVLRPLAEGGSLPVRLIHQTHAGAPAARNRGLAEATGEYVIFWDADVIGEPQMLEKLKNALDGHSQASYVYCNYKLQIQNYKFQKNIKSQNFNYQKLKETNYIHSTSLIRRKDVIKWDESTKRFQDWDLWLTMSEIGKGGVWVDEYLFTVLGGGTISKWLPRIAYKAPFKWLPCIRRLIKEYDDAKKVILQKHKLTLSTPHT